MDNEEIVVALSSPVSSLNSLTNVSYDPTAELLRPLIFNSLTRRAATDLSIEGELAKEIITSPDGKSITFTLRSGIKFHDGRGLTANDVKYSLETLLETTNYKAFAFSETIRKKGSVENARLIAGITVEDPAKITLHMVRPNVKDLILANLSLIPIVPSASITPGQDLRVGTGPYRVVTLDEDEREVLLMTNPLYWDGKPSVASLRFKTILNFQQLYAEIKSGGVDLFRVESWMTPSELQRLESLNRIEIRAFDANDIQYIGLNVQASPLTDLKIRKAIAHAIDRKKLIREHLDGNALPADSVLPQNSWAYSPGMDHEFDIAKARELVRSSEYKDRRIVIQASKGKSHLFPVIASIRDSLKQAGLKVEIEILEASALRTNLMLGTFQMHIGTWIGGNQDPIFFRDLFHSAKTPATGIPCCNRSRYSNPRVDRLLSSAGEQSNRELAVAKYKEAWDIISRELPIIPLWYPSDVIMHDRRIQINSKPNGGFDFLKTVTLRK